MEKYYLNLKKAIEAERLLSGYSVFLAMFEFDNCLKVFTSDVNETIELLTNVSDSIEIVVKTKTNIEVFKK